MLRYSLLVLLGACSYGILAIFVKLAYAEGFSLGEVIGSQYLFGWIILLAITLLFSRHRVPLKQALILFVAGTSASFTGIFYYASLKLYQHLSPLYFYSNSFGSELLLKQSQQKLYLQEKKLFLLFSYLQVHFIKWFTRKISR